MSWKDGFHEALARLIETREQYNGKNVKVTKILSYYEDTYNSGYGGCETCSFTETVADVYYKDDDGDTCSYRYSGSLASLIQELTREDD